MKRQLTILPVREQAPGPWQPDSPLPHFFRLMQYSCRTASKGLPDLSGLVRIGSYCYETGFNLVQFCVKIFSFRIRDKFITLARAFPASSSILSLGVFSLSGIVVNPFFLAIGAHRSPIVHVFRRAYFGKRHDVKNRDVPN